MKPTLPILATIITLSTAHASEPVDTELVLLADVSQSMEIGELQLQRTAYIEALRDPGVMMAIQAGEHGCIMLSFVEFHDRQNLILAPMRVCDDAAMDDAISIVSAAPVVPERGMTAIGDALAFAVRLFSTDARRVIDVSGDGENNAGIPIEAVDLSGVVVNGLPIGGGTIDAYYDAKVVRDGFLIPVASVRDMRDALRIKLIREIAGIDGEIKMGSVE